MPFPNVALESSRPSFDARSPGAWLETVPLFGDFVFEFESMDRLVDRENCRVFLFCKCNGSRNLI